MQHRSVTDSAAELVCDLLRLDFGAVPADSLAAALGEIDFTTLLVSLVSSSERHGELLSVVGADSYRHENGFQKVSLPEFGSPVRARIHAWPSSNQKVPDAHSHRWPFASRVLRGRLRVEFFEPTPDGPANLHHYRHSQINPVTGYRFDDLGMMSLCKVGERELCEGSIYEEPPDLIHRVLNLDNRPAATFVIEGVPVTSTTEVFSEQLKPTGVILDPPRSRSGTILRLLQSLSCS